MTKIDTIGIPLKKASDVEILKPLKNIITSRYQSSEQESYIAAINELSKLRNSAVCRTLDFHENSLEILCKYYDQLAALESKIPANELQIPFKWKDAFDKGSIFGGRISLTLASLSYEKVCVLFNIAALQSQVAANQNLDSDEALKTAAKLFQSSSGIFLHLKTIVHASLQQDPTPDLQPETLSAVAALMLAQAQEVIAVKARSDNMKDAIVAKLFSQCEELYTDALKSMQKEVLKPLWDREWVPKVQGKQIGCQALAMYHQSRVCNASKAVGEEIARLKFALELFKSAQTRSGDSYLFSDDIGRAQMAHDEAVKDNNFIYHERVPDAKNLAPIGKAPVAKQTPIPAQFSSNFADMFENLVPVVIQQALSQYDVRKSEIVNGEVGKLRESTQLLNSILASLNLPAAIEDMRGEKLPQSLRDKSNAVLEKGGINLLNKLLEELPELLKRNKELLDESENLLKEEKDSDDQLRNQFKERWTRTPSDKLTAGFQTNAEKYRKVIETAVQADATIRQKYETHKEGMTLLSQGPEALVASLPSVTASSASSSSPVVLRLRKLMDDVETIKAERDAVESELKGAEIDMKDSFLSALAQDGAINEPAMSVESLGRVFGPLQKQVQESVTRQEALVSDIQEAHSKFSSESGGGGDRESKLKQLASAHDIFIELLENLQEGTKFYNDLTQLLVNFQSKITDFCFARRTEKEELMKDLTQGLAHQSMSSTPTPPAHHQENTPSDTAKSAPPRPPPPQVNPYQGAPQAPPQGVAPVGAPTYSAPNNPPVGAQGYGPPGTLPYPVNPQGMPTPQGGYQYPGYQVYTPMPQGYNPYYTQQPPYATPPYPQQPYQPYPYPNPAPQWPPRS